VPVVRAPVATARAPTAVPVTPRSGQQPVVRGGNGAPAAQPAREEEGPAWERFRTEPEEPVGDLALPRRKTGVSSRRLKPVRQPAGEPRVIWWVFGGVALLVCLAVVLLLYRALFSPTPPAAPGSGERPPIKVDPAAGQRLESVLRTARDGDRIVLQSDITQEVDLLVTKKDLTIEAEPGKTIVWRCPAKLQPTDNKLLLVSGVGGLRLKGITLDGEGRLDNLVVLVGECPGTRLEELHLRGYRKHGILITNCSGTSNRPVVLADLHFLSNRDQAGLFFDILGPGVPANRHIAVRNCTFLGPGSAIRTPNPAYIDRATVDLPPGPGVQVGQ
jgi:hypothetical protein